MFEFKLLYTFIEFRDKFPGCPVNFKFSLPVKKILKKLKKIDWPLHVRQGFRYFLVPNLQSWGSCAVIVDFTSFYILIRHCNCYISTLNYFVKDITYKRSFPFYPYSVYFFLLVKLTVFFCDRTLLSNVCFLTPSIKRIVKRGKKVKNPYCGIYNFLMHDGTTSHKRPQLPYIMMCFHICL